MHNYPIMLRISQKTTITLQGKYLSSNFNFSVVSKKFIIASVRNTGNPIPFPRALCFIVRRLRRLRKTLGSGDENEADLQCHGIREVCFPGDDNLNLNINDNDDDNNFANESENETKRK